jgi:hypothetical protein
MSRRDGASLGPAGEPTLTAAQHLAWQVAEETERRTSRLPAE